MKNIKGYDSFVNESLFKDQVEIKLDLKPGDVLIAIEDLDFNKDVDYARFADSFMGKIKQFNTRNMAKGGERSDWGVAKKGDVLAIVMSNGELSFPGGWSSNIKNIKTDYILIAYNILFNDGKIKIEKYDKNDDFQRKLVFKYNLYRWVSKDIIVKDLNIEVDNKFEECYWDFDKDILYIYNGWDIESGRGGIKQKIINASTRDDIVNEKGKKLNEI